jgi:hypothetical protein
MKLEQIINIGRRFAAARLRLSNIVDRIRDGQAAALNAHRAALRDAVNKANEAQADLVAAITSAPELFTEPRTINVDGIRLGLTTAPARVELLFEEDEVIAAIEKKFPAFSHTLIITKKTPNKKAMATLTDDQLQKIGCARVPADPNTLLIKPTDSAVDKIVKALMEDPAKSATEELPA